MKINPNDPAHPLVITKSFIRNPSDPEGPPIEVMEAKPGMSIRAAIATQIMAGIMCERYGAGSLKMPGNEQVARAAVSAADLLLMELNKDN